MALRHFKRHMSKIQSVTDELCLNVRGSKSLIYIYIFLLSNLFVLLWIPHYYVTVYMYIILPPCYLMKMFYLQHNSLASNCPYHHVSLSFMTIFVVFMVIMWCMYRLDYDHVGIKLFQLRMYSEVKITLCSGDRSLTGLAHGPLV